MGVNSVNAYATQYAMSASQTKAAEQSKKKTEEKETIQSSDPRAAVYEKSTDTTTKYASRTDSATIARLKKECEERTQSLKSLVEKVLLKQGKTAHSASEMFSILRSGEFEVDEETKLQAQKDISEDGYWGVEQTSDRLFSFATALAGNDPDKADEMVAAFKKGYQQATKAWGDELPGICKQTYDAFLKKMDDWKNSNSNSTDSNQVTESESTNA